MLVVVSIFTNGRDVAVRTSPNFVSIIVIRPLAREAGGTAIEETAIEGTIVEKNAKNRRAGNGAGASG
jgi:hypothetical protein